MSIKVAAFTVSEKSFNTIRSATVRKNTEQGL